MEFKEFCWWWCCGTVGNIVTKGSQKNDGKLATFWCLRLFHLQNSKKRFCFWSSAGLLSKRSPKTPTKFQIRPLCLSPCLP